MKNTIVILLTLLGLQSVLRAQDTIVRRDGVKIRAKVLEIDADQVKYKRFDNQDGPVYGEYKTRILKIRYANGSEDVFAGEKTTAASEQVIWQSAPRERKTRKVRYSGLVETVPYIGMLNWGIEYDTYNNPAVGVCIATAHGIQLVDKYFLGAGIGLNIQTHRIYSPVYFNFRLDLSKTPSRPFLSFSLGMQFGMYDNNDVSYFSLGTWSNVLFGYRFGNRWYVAAGLTLQNAADGSSATWNRDNSGWTYNSYSDWEDTYGLVGTTASVGFKF